MFNGQYLTGEVAAKWEECANLLAEVNEKLSQVRTKLTIELDAPEKALKSIDDCLTATSGLSYMFTPQMEWIGEENFKIRSPHICDV